MLCCEEAVEQQFQRLVTWATLLPTSSSSSDLFYLKSLGETLIETVEQNQFF
jgi:hypothetical protein